jgi:hypothetical protein
MSEQIANRPQPLDIIQAGRMRLKGQGLAEAMFRDFLAMTPETRVEFLWWVLQDMAAEQQRMMSALTILRQQIETLTRPAQGSA